MYVATTTGFFKEIYDGHICFFNVEHPHQMFLRINIITFTTY